MQLLKPHALIIGKTVQICVTKCVLLKGFKQSLFCAVSVSLTLKCEVHWKNLLILTAAWLGWVLLVRQFLAAYLTAFCRSASCHKIQCRKHWPFFFFFCSHENSSEPVPSTSAEPADIRPPTQEGRTGQESASTNKRPRLNQVPVKDVLSWRVQAWGHPK